MKLYQKFLLFRGFYFGVGIEKKDSNNAKKILNKIFSIYNLKDLSTTPLLLSMIIDNYNCIENKDNFTSSQLYDLYIKNWLLREDSNIFIPWTEKEDIIELLAWKMYINNVSKIHFKDIEKELMLKFKPNFLEKNYLSNSIRTKSLLTKDDKGYYFFQHRSFMEFIIAKVLLTALRENNLIIFGKKQMYHEVSIFIRGLICKDDFILLSSVLGNILSNEIARFHAANLLTTTFTVLINKKYIGNKLLIFLEKCLENEKSIMVTRQLVYLVCFIKGNKGAIKYLNRLKKNLYEDQLDTFYALNYFGKNLDDAIHGHLKHLKDIRYHKHLIMDLYHLGKIGRLKEIEEIEKFTQYHENIVIEYAKDAIQKIKEREYNE